MPVFLKCKMGSSYIRFFAVISILAIIGPAFTISPALILTPYIHQNRTADARKASLVNPSLFLNITSFSGFLTVDERYNSNTFFWYIPVLRKAVNETPLVVWLQGGPGASSLPGLFDEIGPFEFDEKLILRNQTWCKEFSVLFIDNPIGAGFSFTNSAEGFARDMDTYSTHLYTALQQFLTIFPELRPVELFLAGESYAGRYVPGLAAKILEKKSAKGEMPINLNGLMMGNPVMNRENIDYVRMFYHWGLIDQQGMIAVQPYQERYNAAVFRGNTKEADGYYTELWSKLDNLVTSSFNVLSNGYRLNGFEDFLHREEVRDALHVGEIKFSFSNDTSAAKLLPDFLSDVQSKVENLLEHYRILIYCGQLDLKAPCVPNSEVRRKRWQWSGRESFLEGPRVPWYYDGNVAGYVKSGGRFTEVLVRGAGHLVPLDKPGQTLQLVSRFVRGLDISENDPETVDTPEYIKTSYQLQVEGNPSGNLGSKTNTSSGVYAGVIVSAVINVILILVVAAVVWMYMRLKKKSQDFFYSSVDQVMCDDDIFMS